jgi:hypothetical protein
MNRISRELAVLVTLGFAAQPCGAIDVMLIIESNGANPPSLVGTTNLPDGTELMIDLRRPANKYFGQDKSVIHSGTFRAGPFSKSGQPLAPGKYEITAGTPLPGFMSGAVRAVIGESGENLHGKFTKKSDIGRARVVDYVTTLTIKGEVSAARDRKDAEDATRELAAWNVQACHDRCRIVETYAIKTNQLFDAAACNTTCK